MLFFLGKDIFRWLEQCMDWVQRMPELGANGWRQQSFVELLTVSAPSEVKDKLTRWGVSDYVAIFSRAIGMHVLFAKPPAFDLLTEEFLRNYHKYVDAVYQSFVNMETYSSFDKNRVRFSLYASGEYSRILESQWEGKS